MTFEIQGIIISSSEKKEHFVIKAIENNKNKEWYTWQRKKVLYQSAVKTFFRLLKNGYIPITIFSSVRLISNGCDAITKLKKLDMMGEYELPEDYKPQIQVIVNPEEKTLKFIDNGLGMTADEVEEYITQIAFSGATEFLEKYKDKTTEDEMIGHFGLGFYSAFMVADEVHIDTLSYKEGRGAGTLGE